jgi:DNA primase
MRQWTIILVFLAIFVNLGRSQTAEGYFHLGADLYIKGQFQQAEQVVQEGLRKFPNDPLLHALAEKLKQKKQQQQQQKQQKQNQQQKQGQKKQQQKPNNQKKEQEKKKKQQQARQQKGQKKGMSKKEAERILRALREENKKFKKDHIRVPGGRRQLDKNW